MVEQRARLGLHVGCDTHLDGDAFIDHILHQVGVVDERHTVSDALCAAEPYRVFDVLGTGSLHTYNSVAYQSSG